MPTAPSATASAVMIANVRSRRAAELFALAKRRLGERGVLVTEAVMTEHGDELRERVRNFVAAKQPLVLVGGGDGSLTSVIGEFAHQETVLGVLPFGTGNSFARTLGIEPELEPALDVILNGEVAQVDLGIVNGTYFANFATIGLSSKIGRSTPNLLKKFAGPLAYVLTGIPLIAVNEAFRVNLTRDGGETLSIETHQLIIANGRYYGVVPLMPEATIVDGVLTLFTTDGLNRWDVARLFVALHRGEQRQLDNGYYFAATDITVETTPPQYLDIDGEPLGQTPAHFRIAPNALRVMVPRGFSGT